MATEKRQVLWLIILRLIAVTSILISAAIIAFSTSDALLLNVYYYYIVLFAYGLSFLFFILYLSQKAYTFQAYLQILFDLVLVTALVYISGGVDGPLYFLYVFTIIASSSIISGRAGYLMASLSAILFGLLADGMYFKIIPSFPAESPVDVSFGSVLYTIVIAWAVFFVIAFLVNHLTGNLRTTREKLSQMKKELEIKERLAMAGQVAANLAHEIRNPLAAVSGSVQFLGKELLLNPQQAKLVGIVLRESERVSRSIEQFLDLAVPPKQVFTTIDLAEILRETLAVLQNGGEIDDRFELQGNFASGRVLYYGNSSLFKQIFWNLIKNSLKAMPEGGVLAMDFVKGPRNGILLKFKDTGKGMTEEERSRIFEPFYSGFTNGRGLGMALVKKIVEDHDGTIAVRSEPNQGTEVLISLPGRRRTENPIVRGPDS